MPSRFHREGRNRRTCFSAHIAETARTFRHSPSQNSQFCIRSPPRHPRRTYVQRPRLAIAAFGLLFGRKSLSGSPIGGITENQEMLDFCGKHNITADVEVIAAQQINEACERLLKSDVKYRFTIDMASLKG